MIISAGMRNDGRPIEAVDVRDIKVGVRRRLNLGRYHDLAASIERFGMLHVVLITADGRLVSGARRLEAAKARVEARQRARFAPYVGVPGFVSRYQLESCYELFDVSKHGNQPEASPGTVAVGLNFSKLASAET